MPFERLNLGAARRALPQRSALERRWCSDRRLTDRRRRNLSVTVDRRRNRDRRKASERRSGLDRRGHVAIKTLWYHRCTKVVGEHRSCGQAAILRSGEGWRCFWHLDRRHDRRSH